jgi:hypothetical protein
MSKQTIESLNDLNNLVLGGKLLDAFEKYYHEDIIMQENNATPTVGKTANRERENEFLTNLVEFREATVIDLAVGDNISTVIWHYDYTHKEWGVMNYTQASVQFWKDGLIIREQFIYPSA